MGKSYLAREFVSKEYRSHIYIDFSNVNPSVISIFEDFGHDLDTFFLDYHGCTTPNFMFAILVSFLTKSNSIQKHGSNRLGTRYIVYTKDLERDGELIYLPVYVVGLL